MPASPRVLLLCAAGLSALLAIGCEIIAERSGRRPPAFLLLKPLTGLLIAATLLSPAASPGLLLGGAFGLAIAGDIALMFDGERAFLAGLGSFFLAHLAFVAVFLDRISIGYPPAWTLVFIVYAIGFFAWLLPRTGALRLPTLAYGVVLTAMVLAAAAANAAQPGSATRLALIGALLFAASDSALAVRQFAGTYRGAQPLILSSYWLAIALIALSRWPPEAH